jgi:hypothetical protein
LVNLLSKILGIENQNQQMIEDIKLQLAPYIDLNDNDFLFEQYQIDDFAFWAQIEKVTRLTCPIPSIQKNSSKNIFDKLTHYLAPKTTYDLKKITCNQYYEVICIANYKKLIQPQAIQNQYELYIGIAGILSEQMGIDPFEINPVKTFADDYGMD